MAILQVKSPCILTIIERGAPLVLVVVAGHGGCCQMFGTWDNRLLSNQSWNLICGLLGWVPTISISFWSAVFLDMELFSTLVTSHIWPGRWPYSRATTIFTVTDLEVKLLQSLVDRLLNGKSVCLWKWRLVLRIIFAGSSFLTLWIHNITVFSLSLLYKGLIGYDILLWHDIYVIHTKFLYKLRKLVVLLNIPKKESGVITIFKDVSDVP